MTPSPYYFNNRRQQATSWINLSLCIYSYFVYMYILGQKAFLIVLAVWQWVATLNESVSGAGGNYK